ncbi:MAG: hypothetical protein ACTHJT_01435 [Cytophaga sp.]|uniref:hypothetical protein n=1 Tax=Cytophaga sp. TaxID=29535 RepID=UPI003F8097AD
MKQTTIKTICIFLAGLILCSCSEHKATGEDTHASAADTALKSAAIPDSSWKEPASDSALKPEEYVMYYKKIVAPVTFSVQTPVYSKPDTASKVLKMFAFNTPLIPVLNSEVTDWLEVQLNKDTVYLRTKDVALFSFISSSDKNLKYYVQGKNETTVIYKYNLEQKKYLDTFSVPEFIPDYIGQVNSVNWENTDLVIYLNSNGNCCGCSDKQKYLIDANGTFDGLIETSQYIDDGEIEAGSESHVYFPADPQTQDIIYNEYEYGILTDKDGNEIFDKKGNPVTGTNKDIKKYYRWDGKKMIEQKR